MICVPACPLQLVTIFPYFGLHYRSTVQGHLQHDFEDHLSMPLNDDAVHQFLVHRIRIGNRKKEKLGQPLAHVWPMNQLPPSVLTLLLLASFYDHKL